jgi:hypothetical protein
MTQHAVAIQNRIERMVIQANQARPDKTDRVN